MIALGNLPASSMSLRFVPEALVDIAVAGDNMQLHRLYNTILWKRICT